MLANQGVNVEAASGYEVGDTAILRLVTNANLGIVAELGDAPCGIAAAHACAGCEKDDGQRGRQGMAVPRGFHVFLLLYAQPGGFRVWPKYACIT